MANVQYTENLTEEQLDAMAGSETLRYQATSFGVTRNNKVLYRAMLATVFWDLLSNTFVLEFGLCPYFLLCFSSIS